LIRNNKRYFSSALPVLLGSEVQIYSFFGYIKYLTGFFIPRGKFVLTPTPAFISLTLTHTMQKSLIILSSGFFISSQSNNRFPEEQDRCVI